MTIERYTTILGEVIEYPRPTPDVAAFLASVKRAAHDPSVSEAQLAELVYGRANPILDQTVFPGRGAVTKAVHANPVWHVMQDLLDAKRVQGGTLDAGLASADFSMSVREAAERLEMSEGAVRQAIASEHLSAVKRGNVYEIDPRSVETYRQRVKRRGPPARVETYNPKDHRLLHAALRARVGNAPGVSFRIKAADFIETARVGDHVVEGQVPKFVQAAVIFGGRAQQRMFIIEHDVKAQDEFRLKDLFIAGNYRVLEKINNPAEAATRWRHFRPIATRTELEARIAEAKAEKDENEVRRLVEIRERILARAR